MSTKATAILDLTPRQASVAQHVAQGEPNKVIAHELNITYGTVKQHMYFIFRKLRITNRTELALLVLRASACLLLAFSLSAQPSIFVTGPNGMQRAGSTITLGVSISGAAGATDQSIQFSLPISWPVSASVGAAATGAGKQIVCATVGASLNCIVYGLNSTPLADGQLATLSVTIPRNATAGTLSITPSGLVAATTDASGNVTSAPVVAGGPFGLSITSACDINADGKVDTNDAILMIPQILGAAACSANMDIDSDGKCTAVDLQIVANAASGGKCAAK